MCVFFLICSLFCFFLNMATFDLNQFIDRPSVEGLEVCQKILFISDCSAL